MSDISLSALEPSPDPMAAETDLAEGISVTSRSPFQLAVRRFLRHHAAVAGSIVLLLITAAVVLAPWIAPYGETQLVGNPPHRGHHLPAAAVGHWFGTDSIGRDMYSLILWGGRISLFIGLAVALSASIIGTLLGAFAGFRGGKLDDFLMRFTDLFLAFPLLVALLVIRQLPQKQPWAKTAFGAVTSIRLTITLLVIVSGWARPASSGGRCCR